MVRYTLKPDQVSDNEALVREVFSELERGKPDGVRYASFKESDGVSFVHLASIETAEGRNPLLELEAFRAFTRAIADRCVAPPVSVTLEQVGAYRLLAE